MRQKKILRKKLKILGNSLLLLISLLLAYNVVLAVYETGYLISVPRIVIYPEIYYPLDETLYIEGSADPLSQVGVVFQKQGELPVKFSVKADAGGQWVLSEKAHLSSGTWEVRARSENPENGAVSDWSNPRLIRSVISALTFLGVQVKYITITLGILFIISIIVLIFIYFSMRVRKIKKTLLQEQVREAGKVVERGFEDIKEDLVEDLKSIEKGDGNNKLSAERLARTERVLHELENVEKDIEREIDDIEDKL